MDEKKKFLSKNGVSHIWLTLKQYFNQKVDKVEGKQLSTNDFTDEYKNKIDNAGSGNYADITGKPQINEHELKSGNNTLEDLGIIIPDTSDFITEETLTSKNYATETFVTDKGYQTSSDVEETLASKNYATETFVTNKGYQTASDVQSALNSALEGITGIDFQVVEQLPSSGKKGIIYLKSNGGSNNNIYDEFIWLEDSSKFEKIGTTDIDLTDYIKSSDLEEITNEEIDEIIPTVGLG